MLPLFQSPSDVSLLLVLQSVKTPSGFSLILLQNEFRDYPPLLRQAVSLARRIQDPLIEFAQVCSSDEDILCLKLHPLQVTSS